jgi:membrane-associated protease RseP (regulator of RpoE activity)
MDGVVGKDVPMISIVSAADGEAAGRLLVVVALAAVVVAVVLASGGRGGRAAAGGLTIVGLALVGGLTLSRVTGLPGNGCATDPGAPLDDLPNVALFFVPLLFAVVATRRPVLVLFAGPALSAAIEWVQDVVPSLGRRCDVDDLLANSAGAVAAVLVGSAILGVTGAITRRRDAAERSARARAATERALSAVR